MSAGRVKAIQIQLFDESEDFTVGLTGADKNAFVAFALRTNDSSVTDLTLNPNDAQSRDADEKKIETLLFEDSNFDKFKSNFLKLIYQYLKRLKERKPSTRLNPSLAFTSAFNFFNNFRYQVPGLNQIGGVSDKVIPKGEMKQDFLYCRILKSFFKGRLLQDAFNPNPPNHKANPDQIYNLVANIGEALVLFSQNYSEVEKEFLARGKTINAESQDRQLPQRDRLCYNGLHSA